MVLSVKNVNNQVAFGGFKKVNRPKERPYPKFEREEKRDSFNIMGKEVKKKTVITGGALLLALIGAGAVILNRLKKGKTPLAPTGKENLPEIKPKTKNHKKPETIKPKAKTRPTKTDFPKAEPVKVEPVKVEPVKIEPVKVETPVAPNAPLMPNAPLSEQAMKPSKEPFSPDEIRAEALKRNRAKENAKIAQDYFFDLSDESCGKSAEDSAKFFKYAFDVEEDSILRMSSKIYHMPESEKTPENILKAITERMGDVFKKVDKKKTLSDDKVLKIIYDGPTMSITDDGRVLLRWSMPGWKNEIYHDVTQNYINRAKTRNFN